MILNVYAANNRALKYMKQKLIGLKGEIYTCTAGGFNIPLSAPDRRSEQS